MIAETIDYKSYILNDENMLNYLKYKLHNSNDQKNDKTQKKEKSTYKSDLFIPRENDSLFWCYYIISNGDNKYQMLNVKNSLIEKQLKIDYINKIRNNKQIIKSYKFDTIINIENNLANENLINIKTVMTLFVVDKINLIFVSKNTYFELLMNDTEPVYIIREIQSQSKYKSKYGFEISNKCILDDIKSNFFQLDTLNKPIKAISAYKVDDLINIAKKLAIDIFNKETGKNMSKNQLYEEIIKYF